MDDANDLGHLRLYNVGMGLLHAVQGIAVVVLSNDFTLPVTAAFMEGPPGSPASTEELFTLPLRPAVAMFLFLSAAAHCSSPARCGAGIGDTSSRDAAMRGGWSTRSARR